MKHTHSSKDDGCKWALGEQGEFKLKFGCEFEFG